MWDCAVVVHSPREHLHVPFDVTRHALQQRRAGLHRQLGTCRGCGLGRRDGRRDVRRLGPRDRAVHLLGTCGGGGGSGRLYIDSGTAAGVDRYQHVTRSNSDGEAGCHNMAAEVHYRGTHQNNALSFHSTIPALCLPTPRDQHDLTRCDRANHVADPNHNAPAVLTRPVAGFTLSSVSPSAAGTRCPLTKFNVTVGGALLVESPAAIAGDERSS